MKDMLKAAFINFIKNLKVLLMIMGVVYFAILILLFVLFGGVYLPIVTTSQEAFLDVVDYVRDTFSSMNLSSFFSAAFLRNFIKGLSSSLDGFENALVSSITVRAAVSVAAIITVCKATRLITRSSMRKQMASAESLKGVLLFIFRVTVSIVFWAAYFIVSYLWFFAAFLLPLLSLIFNAVKDIYSAWFVHFKKYELKQLLTFKNVARLIVSTFTVQILAFVLCLIVALVFNVVFALIIAIPLFTYISAVMDLTSTRYFKDMQEKHLLQIKQ